MSKLGNRHALLAGLVIIILTNVVALAGALYNRSGSPESTLVLTNRELVRIPGWGWKDENNSADLQLQWRVAGVDPDHYILSYDGHLQGREGSQNWLNETKLKELGFDISAIRLQRSSGYYFHRSLPRKVFLVLENDGPAYQRALSLVHEQAAREAKRLRAAPDDHEFKRNAESSAQRLALEETETSRLFVVDAGLNRKALRQKYPDNHQYAIVQGQVRTYAIDNGGSPRVAGSVTSLNIDTVNMPASIRESIPLFAGPAPNWPSRNKAKYSVSIAYGQRLEPWVRMVTELP